MEFRLTLKDKVGQSIKQLFNAGVIQFKELLELLKNELFMSDPYEQQRVIGHVSCLQAIARHSQSFNMEIPIGLRYE